MSDIDDILAVHEQLELELEDRLTEFFYLLMRDRLPTGEVVEVLRTVTDKRRSGKVVYSSPELAAYGRAHARHLMGRKPPEHAWARHTLDPGSSTCLESCWKCGTFRLSDGGMPQDGYEYFAPGKLPERDNFKQLRGADTAPECKEL